VKVALGEGLVWGTTFDGETEQNLCHNGPQAVPARLSGKSRLVRR
jgi:hypothetical protein